MIKLWEPVVGIIFLWNKFVFNRYKICAASISNTGKQQFSANQSIYQLLDKDRSVPYDIDLCRSVWTRLLYAKLTPKFNLWIYVVVMECRSLFSSTVTLISGVSSWKNAPTADRLFYLW